MFKYDLIYHPFVLLSIAHTKETSRPKIVGNCTGNLFLNILYRIETSSDV
jgi:hypothetical protein